MYKQLIVLGLIVTSVIVLEFITQNYTKKASNELNANIAALKDELKKDNKDNVNILNTANKVYDGLMEHHNKLALYLDHSELEKVETSIVVCKSSIEAEDYALATTELDKAIFILNHIEDKYAFNLANIF